MMHVLIPIDKEFKYLECKKLYEQNKVFVNDDATFDEVINNTLFYSFYEVNILFYDNVILFII